MIHRVVRWLGLASLLTVCWYVLSGKFDLMHFGVGVIVALLLSAYYYPWQGQKRLPIIRFLAFIPWELWQIVISNLRVARLVLTRKSGIAPALIRRRPELEGDVPLTTLACAITLTPGTLTIEVDDDHILVHALDEMSRVDIERSVMDSRLREVFVKGR